MNKTETEYTFAAADNGVLTDNQAQFVGPELLRIKREREVVKASIVVDTARPQDALLHSFFTWDDGKAAELYREDEARHLIRSVLIIKVGQEEIEPVRAFVSVRAVRGEKRFEGQGYITTLQAVSEPKYRDQVLEEARKELVGWRKRYVALKEFAAVFSAIDELR